MDKDTKLLANQANSFLLAINTDGAAPQTCKDHHLCTTCNKNEHVSDECWCGAERKLGNVIGNAVKLNQR